MKCTHIASNSLVYEWDSEKNKINLKKHGISLEFAIAAFDDPNGVFIDDKSHSIGEERLQYIGEVSGIMLTFVVFTERETLTQKVVRIISARKATKQEKEIYVKQGR